MTAIIVLSAAVLFGALAIATAIGAGWIARAYPPSGRLLDIAGRKVHVVELGPAATPAGPLPVVLIHGASGNLADMRYALGERIAKHRRVILIDRPGRGWTERKEGRRDAAPARQAALVRDTLDHLGIARAIVVGHSWGGALAAALAVDHPERVAGLVLLGAVTHPWPGPVAWHYRLAVVPGLGRLLAHTVLLPAGLMLLDREIAGVFQPQRPPADYRVRSALPLVLRPEAFIANAQDIHDLKDNVAGYAPRYREIGAPTVVMAGAEDHTVSPRIHSEAIARALPDARLEILPGVGHMLHYAAPERIEAAIAEVAAKASAPL